MSLLLMGAQHKKRLYARNQPATMLIQCSLSVVWSYYHNVTLFYHLHIALNAKKSRWEEIVLFDIWKIAQYLNNNTLLMFAKPALKKYEKQFILICCYIASVTNNKTVMQEATGITFWDTFCHQDKVSRHPSHSKFMTIASKNHKTGFKIRWFLKTNH